MPIDLLDILSILLVLSGLVFFLGASVGLLRFPDFYTRMHAAGKGDTLSTLLIMAGAGIYELHRFDLDDGGALGIILVVVKILAIGVFIMLTSPTSTHALMQAGYDDQLERAGESSEVRIELPALHTPADAGTPEELPSPDEDAASKSAMKKTASKKAASGKSETSKDKTAAKKSTSKQSPRRKKD